MILTITAIQLNIECKSENNPSSIYKVINFKKYN